MLFSYLLCLLPRRLPNKIIAPADDNDDLWHTIRLDFHKYLDSLASFDKTVQQWTQTKNKTLPFECKQEEHVDYALRLPTFLRHNQLQSVSVSHEIDCFLVKMMD